LTGAAILTARSSLRTGAGLVTLGIPKSLNNIFQKQLVEVMTLPLAQTSSQSASIKALPKINNFLKKVDVLAIGPGLSLNLSTQKLVRSIIAHCKLKMVIDADAINALAANLKVLKLRAKKRLNRNLVLTPHPGEMARLIAKSTSYVQGHRKEVASKFSKEFGLTLILKGYRSIVADFSGKVYINTTGNPGMATAGCGDVLTGIVASFLAQGLDVYSAAKYATYIHGLAGDLAARESGELSLIASDLIERIPEAIKKSSQ